MLSLWCLGLVVGTKYLSARFKRDRGWVVVVADTQGGFQKKHMLEEMLRLAQVDTNVGNHTT